METWLVIGKGDGRAYATYVNADSTEMAKDAGGLRIMSALNKRIVRLPELCVVRAVRMIKQNGLINDYQCRSLIVSDTEIRRIMTGKCNTFYGCAHGPEAREKCKAATLKRYAERGHPCTGTHLSLETRKKISKVRRRKDMEQYEICLAIAEKAHKGQQRWGGEPFIIHPKAVAARFERYHVAKCASILHDVIEDTGVTAEDMLKAGVNSEVVKIVVILTRRSGQSYAKYIEGCAKNTYARKIKMADLRDNLRTIKPGSLRDKYELALYILRGEK